MRKSKKIVLFLIITLAGCSGLPSRHQVEQRKTSGQRLQESVYTKEHDLHRLRGTYDDDPTPGVTSSDGIGGKNIKVFDQWENKPDNKVGKSVDDSYVDESYIDIDGSYLEEKYVDE